MPGKSPKFARRKSPRIFRREVAVALRIRRVLLRRVTGYLVTSVCNRLPQRNRLSVRRVPVGVGPASLRASIAWRGSRQVLFRHKPLQRRQPVAIIMRAIVGFAPVRRGLEFTGQRLRPFLPCEMALLGEPDRERECLRLPWLGEYRPPSSRGSAAMQTLGSIRIRRAQDSRPTYRCKRNRAGTPARPTSSRAANRTE